MNRLQRGALRRLVFVFNLAWLLLGIGPAASGQPATAEQPPAERKSDWPVIRFSRGSEQGSAPSPAAFLDRRCDIVVQDMKLGKLAELLSNLGGVSVMLENTALESINVTSDTLVSLDAKGLTLRAALNRLLSSIDPALAVNTDDEVLSISTKEAAYERMTLEIYKVGDLATRGREPSDILHAYHETIAPAAGPSLEDLVEMLAKIVEPPSWDAEGGPGAIRTLGNDLLLIANTPQCQREIVNVLEALREVRDRQKEIGGGSLLPCSVESRAERDFHERVRAGLAKRVSLDFDGSRLDDAMDRVAKLSGLSVRLDKAALEAISISGENLVTVRLTNLSLRSALKLLLRQLDPTLDWAVYDEGLVITTKEGCQEHMDWVLYPVSDLLAAGPAGAAAAPLSMEDLIDAITHAVGPESWDSSGGPASALEVPLCGCLAICQTPDNHENVADILAQIRKTRPAQVGPKPAGAAAEASKTATSKPVPAAAGAPQVVIYHLRPVPPSAITWFGLKSSVTNQKRVNELMQTIIECVGKAEWPAESTSIRCLGEQLIIRQSPANQKRIHALLNELESLQHNPNTRPGSFSPFRSVTPVVG